CHGNHLTVDLLTVGDGRSEPRTSRLDGQAGLLVPERPAPPAALGAHFERAHVPAQETIRAAASDAYFRAEDRRERPSSGVAPRPDEDGSGDESAEVIEPSADN